MGDWVYVGSCAGYVYAFDLVDGDLRWSFDVSVDGGFQFHGAPWISDTILIVGTDMGSEHHGVLYAWHRLTGKLLWKREWDTGIPSGIVGTDSLVYLISQSDEVSAVRVRDGTTRWSFATHWSPDETSAGGGEFRDQVNTELLLIGNRVYVAGRDDVVYALDALTGGAVWFHPVPDHITSHLLRADSVLLLGTGAAEVLALNPVDGQIVFAQPSGLVPVGGMDRSGDLLFFLSGPNPRRPTEILAHDLKSGRMLWSQTSPGVEEEDAYWYVPRVHLWTGAVVVGTSRGNLAGFAQSDGQTTWSHTMMGAIRGIGHSGDSLLLVGTFEGVLLALRVSN